MRISRRLAIAIVVACSLLFALARTGVLRYWAQASQALGEGPRIEFSLAGISQAERKQFLDGDFTIVKDVKALPRPVINAFTEKGSSRLLMANPGKRFEVGDVIVDSSLPRERLIFAGVLNAKCFVHYEQGGRAHSYVIAFFNVVATDGMKPIWRGYCTGPALNISDLRSQVISGNCR
jgi:hypothetical protein